MISLDHVTMWRMNHKNINISHRKHGGSWSIPSENKITKCLEKKLSPFQQTYQKVITMTLSDSSLILEIGPSSEILHISRPFAHLDPFPLPLPLTLRLPLQVVDRISSDWVVYWRVPLISYDHLIHCLGLWLIIYPRSNHTCTNMVRVLVCAHYSCSI